MHIGWTHRNDARQGWSDSRKKSFDLAAEYANKVLAINDASGAANHLLADIHLMKRKYEKALNISPDFSDIQAARGFALNYLGMPQEAIVHFKKAMRLSPFYPAWYHSHLGLSYHLTGHYEKAIEQTPDAYYPHVRLAAVYSLK